MAGKDNMAAWLYGVDDLRVQPHHQRLDQPLQANEVRVQVGALGICGSDVHYLKHMRIGDFVVNEPMIIGHESAGMITEIGPGVKHLKVGDRVAMEPGIPCRCCHLCKEGVYNLCEEMEFFATPPVHGSLANFVVHPADFCFPLPDGMTLEEGAMCEPVSVGIHACKRSGVRPGTLLAVLGAGPIGLVTLLVAKAFGATSIVITDISDERLTVAKALGATACINVANLTTEETCKRITEALGGRKPHVTADCCGFTSSMAAALAVTASGGKVCLIGMGHGEMTLPLTASAAREVDILGVFRYRNAYPLAIDLISKRHIDVQPLITNRFNLVGGFSQEVIKEGFEVSAKGRNAIKADAGKSA
ncbi:sorbitol dehydrogenase [Tribonema minus]|uniref:Sorbitol dehydrogenase n=1 Tax=Tribonema minus TaxID=303371 RepID=A0A836CMG9_9STRA|nr:sorbitol dehydrogenase [Tribonema minus]